MTSILTGSALEDEAYAISAQFHLPKRYNMHPYINHPIEVATLAGKLGYSHEVLAGCYLHDVVEDTDASLDLLIAKGMPLVVVEAVEAVTFTDEDKANGVDKIEKAMSHPIGHVIKFCDSSRNLVTTSTFPDVLNREEPGKARRFAERYIGYLSRLVVDLPTPEDISNYLVLRAEQ